MSTPLRARAELVLVRPVAPTLTWGRGTSPWMPVPEERFAPVPRPGIVWSPSFAAFSIGVSGQASFRLNTNVALAPLSFVSILTTTTRDDGAAFCIGPMCPGRRVIGADGPGSGDAAAQAGAGSTRFINDLGPMAAGALALFANPVATPEKPVVLRVAPMFAMGGGGLEMKCAWW